MAADNGADQLWGGHFVAGAGVYIIRPYFQNNPAYFTETFASAGVSVFTFETAQHDFSWGLNAAPVVWLGYVSECGLGVRARWWLFDQRSATSAMSDPNTIVFSAAPGGLSIETPTGLPFSAVEPGSRMFVSSNLKLNVWDFEGTWETAAGRWGLLFSGGAYVLLEALRRLGLAGTELARAQVGTIRLKLLKIGALSRITVRKVWVSLAGGYPYAELFRQIHAKLSAIPLKG